MLLQWRAGTFDLGRIIGYYKQMDVEQAISEIERLERWYALRDTRPLRASDVEAANRQHDAVNAHSPWFKLWQDFGVCCR